MVAIIGLASRTQLAGSEKVYEFYLKNLRDVYDANIGIISRPEDLENKIDELSKHDLIIAVVLTGGTRKYLLRIANVGKYMVIMTHEKQNSLASGLHAVYILSKKKRRGVIHIHAPPSRFSEDIKKVILALKNIANYSGKEIILLGVEEKYLADEGYSIDDLSEILNIKVRTVPLEKIIDIHEKEAVEKYPQILESLRGKISKNDLDKLIRLHSTMKKLMGNSIGGGIRCFPLISKLGITPCIIVASFIDSGLPLACEADLPALITMLIIQAITGEKAFIANIEDVDKNTIVVAHCTVAPSLTSSYEFVSHFETGLPIAIEGKLFRREVTLVKISPDFTKIFVIEGKIEKSGKFSEEFCRTQAVIRTEKSFERFLKGDFAHHIVLVYGRHGELIKKVCEALGISVVDV